MRQEFYPRGGPDEPEGASSQPDEDSTENVKEQLEQEQQKLLKAGHISSSELDNAENGETTIEIDKTSEEFAESLREALAAVGLSGFEAMTPERLAKSNPDILGSLNKYTIESLYYDTFKKSRRWLGSEPVKLKILIKQAKSLYRKGIDLEKMQLLQRMEALEKLPDMGVSEQELLRMLKGREGKKQNINRLGFVLMDEPLMNDFKELMKEHALEKGSLHVLDIVDAILVYANGKINYLEKLKDKQSADGTPLWEAVHFERYRREIQRYSCIASIVSLIQDEMSTTLEEFLEED